MLGRCIETAEDIGVGHGLAVDGEVGVTVDADRRGFMRGRCVAGAAGSSDGGRGSRGGGLGVGDFVRDDLEETGEAGFGEMQELGAHAGEIDEGAVVADFNDQVEGLVVEERAGVGRPAGGRGRGGIWREVDAGAAHVF